MPAGAPRFVMGQALVCELAVANRFARLRLTQASIAAMITIMTVTSSAVFHVRSQTVGAAPACGLIRVRPRWSWFRPAGVKPRSTRYPPAGQPRSTRPPAHPAIVASYGDIGSLREPKNGWSVIRALGQE